MIPMIEDSAMNTKRFDFIHNMKLRWARFRCRWFDHKGPIISQERFTVIPGGEKQNKDHVMALKGLYFKRKCRRYGCAEEFVTLRDRISE